MLANMASSLIKHKKITTTVAKAKALRVYVEPLITKGKNPTQHNYRTVFAYLTDKEAVNELFKVVGEKVANRNGGYTRILKIGNRAGDNADMAIIELVDFNEFFTGFGSDAASTKSKRTRRGSKKATATDTPKTMATANVEEVEAVVEDVVADVVEETEVKVEAPAKTGDDLTKINGVGPAFAQILNDLGIFTFADLAALTEEKIAELEEKDSMTSPEEWNNWIEEAKGM
jgi:large subunit ribosomal protein L17